jgi:tetratricopeptide (TPR) repeat protein
MSTVTSEPASKAQDTAEASSPAADFVLVDTPDFAAEGDLSRKSWRELISLGRECLQNGHVASAQRVFKRALDVKPNHPLCRSYLGLCYALLNPCSVSALPLCKTAASEMHRPDIFLNLGKVYMVMENRQKAVAAFDHGLAIDPRNEALRQEMQRIGVRKRPVLFFLPRENVLNVKLGKLFKRMGLR